MRIRLAAFVVMACVYGAVAADKPSVAGNWQVHSVISGTESDVSCSFTQKETELTGTCLTDQGVKAPVTGKVDGSKVTWSYKSEYQGTPLTVNHEGTLEGAKITGTVSVPEFSVDGEFTATQAAATPAK